MQHHPHPPSANKSAKTHPLPTPGGTTVFHTADGAPYVICRCYSEPFFNPTTTLASSDAVNETLNLNLGQSLIIRDNVVGRIFRFFYRLLDLLLVQWWEPVGMAFYHAVPISWKRQLTRIMWKGYLSLHSTLLGKRTGLHPSQSLEYHALTTALFQSKFLAWTPRRMRFFLRELPATTVTDPPAMDRVDVIEENLMEKDTVDLELPKEQRYHGTVKGWYIHNNSIGHKKKRGIIFWIYGGAYLSGDVRGNASSADALAQATNCDAVFVPQFRLAPEANLWDVLWDLCLALYWLQQKLKASHQEQPVFLMGVSSGAALATRLLQLMAHQSRKESLDVPDYFLPLVSKLNLQGIGGAVLFGPYVDYEQLYQHERKGSFLHYSKHDLIVNEAVQEYGLPYLKDFIPILDEDRTGDMEKDSAIARRKQSPIHQSCRGMPPLCVISSEHECVYDQTIELVNRARKEGVEVTVGVWKYMCHVFSLLNMMVPEGQLSIDFAVAWVHEQQEG